MQAWRFSSTKGGLEKNLHLENSVKKPAEQPAGSSYVLIEVLSASLNPADYKLPETWPFLSRFLYSRPATPCLDFCGRIVDSNGHLQDTKSLRKDLKHGQLVFGRHDMPKSYGALAKFTLAPLSGVVGLPEGHNVNEAAAIGTGAVTAYQSICPYVEKGSRVFINGGSGGVGTFSTQIAKLRGCHVTVSCSGANAQLCRDLGADEVIDYRSVDLIKELTSKGEVFDLAVDNVGAPHSLYKVSGSFLKRDGQFIQVVGQDKSWLDILGQVSLLARPSFMVRPRRWKVILAYNDLKQLTEIRDWFSSGQLKIVLDSTFPFQDAPRAFEKLKTGRTRGKIVVDVSGS